MFAWLCCLIAVSIAAVIWVEDGEDDV